MIRITTPDGIKRETTAGTTLLEAARTIDPRLGATATCASIDGALHDLRDPIERDCLLAIHTNSTREGHGVLRHTAAHIAAHAVKRLFPSAVQGFGQATGSGFLLDFEVARPFSAEDLSRIECEMVRIIDADLPIERSEMSKGDVRMLLVHLGEVLRVELLEELEGRSVTLYSQGEHVDVCQGPHVASTGCVPDVKLTGLARAHWRADPNAPLLYRIYGVVACAV